MWLKETHVIVLIPCESLLLCNGGKGVTNYIMGSSAFIAMNAM
jgi:hypothetical protein